MELFDRIVIFVRTLILRRPIKCQYIDCKQVLSSRYADHRWDSRYITYYCMWFRLFFTAVVPLVALVYFNIKIVLFFRKHNFNKVVNTINASTSTVANGETQPTQATSNGQNGHETVNRLISIDDRNEQANKMNRDKERSLVLIVCCITSIFLLCHLPR